MHPLVADQKQAIRALCRKYGVRRLEVFGSAARGEDFEPGRSDIDFLVEVEPNRSPAFSMTDYLDLQEELAELLGRPVDLVMANSVQNPYRRTEIERSREVVHDA